MGEIWVYADETGNLDHGTAGKSGASDYFGFGTATFDGDHGPHLWSGLKLRATVEAQGLSLPRGFHARPSPTVITSRPICHIRDHPRQLSLPRGFHAKDDSRTTRSVMFDEIARQAPRFDATLLYKPNAYDRVRAQGEMRLYKTAWFLHLRRVAVEVAQPGDTITVVAGSFGTRARATQARAALADVCEQVQRDIRLCVWDAPTSWGLQVADYGLWAVQRRPVKGECSWFEACVRPSLVSTSAPWGRHDRSRA